MTAFFEQLMESPQAFVDNTFDQGYRLSRTELDAFHKHWTAKRFAQLRPQIPFLDKLAKEHGIESLKETVDVLPLLFAHTVYKSYPLSYLERNRFDKLTKWLSGLTAMDLSHIDAAGIESIDDWLDLLDKETPLMVHHTSGTTGKLSFLPRTKLQARQVGILTSNMLRDWDGPHSRPDMLKQHRPLISAGYRHGAAMAQRMAGIQVELYAGSDDNALFLYPDLRFSADLQSLAGRMRAAEAKGELGSLEISPALLRRREELIERERQRPQAMAGFLDTARTRFAGQDIYIGGIYSMVLDWAVDGLKQGHKQVFGANSFLSTGGGMKGRVFPDNWRDTIREFLGFGNFQEVYAMTECMGMAPLCSEGHYHLPVTTVPFLLDPKSGALLPQRDGTTGRFAFMDLLSESYWAAMISGDKVTMGGWQAPCACGRVSCYVEKDVTRLTAEEGGDDKVLCSGAPEAHNAALDFLASYSN